MNDHPQQNPGFKGLLASQVPDVCSPGLPPSTSFPSNAPFLLLSPFPWLQLPSPTNDSNAQASLCCRTLQGDFSVVSYVVPPGSPVSTPKGTVSDGKHEPHPPNHPQSVLLGAAWFTPPTCTPVCRLRASHSLWTGPVMQGWVRPSLWPEQTSGHASVTCCHREIQGSGTRRGVGSGWGCQGQPGWRGAEVLPTGPVAELTVPLPSEIPNQNHSRLSAPLHHRVLSAPAWQPRTHWSSPFWLVSPVCPFFKTQLSTSHSPG